MTTNPAARSATIRGDVLVTWQALLEAVERYTAEAPVGQLAWLDADRLIAAANNVSIRLTESEDSK